ncbi:hypothetical protein [Corynebacterium callunae]|uniref:hypothetical protein n=1 Tax=Corynebacterium callunae TaxID=1721 RepID=UPI001FFEAED2|nr:hypothetical protein [Corynebacterium callunae]MCK2200571.1 hypothetical protein [Corynebacterium callunae]
MSETYCENPSLDDYEDWVIFNPLRGTWSEDLPTLKDAKELSTKTGNGTIYHRRWTIEQ